MPVAVSRYRMESLLAAEALAQHLRQSIAAHGGITRDTLAFLDQWMRRAGKTVYDIPKKPSPVWCCSCKRRHYYGQCGD